MERRGAGMERRALQKVALFVPSMTAGGAEKMFRRLAAGFAGAGLSVDLVLSEATGPLLEGVAGSVRVVDLECKRILASSGPLARYLDSAKPDALISTLHYANIMAVIARSRAAASPFLILREANTMSLDAGNSPELRMRLIPKLARVFYPRADVIAANSKGVADDLVETIGIPRSMVRVIHNPTWSDDLLPLMNEPVSHPWFADKQVPVVVSIGRLFPSKGFDLLIEAVCEVQRHRPVRLVIFGEGEERPKLEQLINDRQAAGFVSLPGYAANPYAYLARADLFVLSSHWEGLPNSLIEALGCGLTVVATDCPSGPREILDMPQRGRGRFGALISCGDYQAMAAAISEELDNRRDQEAQRQQARRFSADRAVASYLALMRAGVH